MMQWMSLLFPVVLYNGPAGLNLYILSSTAIGIVESKIVRDHIKQREEAERAEKVIVEAPATRGSKRKREEAPPVKKKGLMGWLSELQSKAEQMREQQKGGR
jgi:membrane protein insertase Oxa1/YidC/SpoIIIJ